MRHSDKWKILFDRSNRNTSYPIYIDTSCNAIFSEVKAYVGARVSEWDMKLTLTDAVDSRRRPAIEGAFSRYRHWFGKVTPLYVFYRYKGYYYLDLYTSEEYAKSMWNTKRKTVFSVDDGYKKEIYPWETILQAKEHDPALGCYTNLSEYGAVQKYFAFPVGDCRIEDVPDDAFPCYYVTRLRDVNYDTRVALLYYEDKDTPQELLSYMD